MFTGLIEAVLEAYKDGSNLKIICPDQEFSSQFQLGDSVAINGVCLTVTAIHTDQISFFLMQETLAKTTFNSFANQQIYRVNLEKALISGQRYGGHIIQGHGHDKGQIIDIINNDDGSRNVWLQSSQLHKVIYKDSIAVNGVSLTVAEVTSDKFRLSLIPFTIQQTNLEQLEVGDEVNLEYNTGYSDQNLLNDDYYMKLALVESKKGRLTAPPNPWIGCLIVYNHTIIARGYHQKPGNPHAEIEAIKQVSNPDLLAQTTLYVTLEPCHHYEGKRTGSCAEEIVRQGIKRVVIGCLDEDERVKGHGLDYLRDNGVIAIVGCLENKIKKSLRAYFYQRRTGLPYCAIKIALSIDGHPALQSGESQWITGSAARQHGHKLRAKSQAIIVGAGTVNQDNPRLTVRLENLPANYQPPLRVILTSLGNITKGHWLEDGQPTLILTSLAGQEKLQHLVTNQIEVRTVTVKDGRLSLSEVLQLLAKRNILHCLIEGGPKLHDDFLRQDLVQEIHIYRGNILLGQNGAAWHNLAYSSLAAASKLTLATVKSIGQDIYSRYEPFNWPETFLPNKSPSVIEQAMEQLKLGRPIILLDNPERENEGDLIMGAEFVTEEWITFYVNHTTGILCVAMDERRAQRLHLPLLKNSYDNQDINCTPFTISCDHKNCKTGVSSAERTLTISRLAAEDSNLKEFNRPGHIFPLIAASSGLFDRQGHTEGSLECCKLAGIKPVAIVAELVKKDGQMMRPADCRKFAQEHNLVILTMTELFDHIKAQLWKITRPLASCQLQLNNNLGAWQLIAYNSEQNFYPHRVLIKGQLYENSEDAILTRIHSECFTGDVLGSLSCDCGEQLSQSLSLINQRGKGLIILPAQHEGRGIGLTNKIRAYRQMRVAGLDTYQANQALGFKDDERDFSCVNAILDDLAIGKIDLLTNNKIKTQALAQRINQVIALDCSPNQYNQAYLQIKQQKYGVKSKDKIMAQRSQLISNKIQAVNQSLQKIVLQKKEAQVAIIQTVWNEDLLNDFRSNLTSELEILTLKEISVYFVSGAFEVPFLAKQLIKKQNYQAIICLGVIIKGATAHFKYISEAVVNGLMGLQVEYDTPIINGILNVYSKEQAIERLAPNNGLAQSLAATTVQMINLT